VPLTQRYISLYRYVVKLMNLYLKRTQIKILKSLCKQTGAPVAELIRRAIDEFIRRQSAENLGADRAERPEFSPESLAKNRSPKYEP
jgi:hypothetical protein